MKLGNTSSSNKVVTLMTRYPVSSSQSKILQARLEATKASIIKLQALKIPCVVVDQESDPTILQWLSDHVETVVCASMKLTYGQQRRAAIIKAQQLYPDADILVTEPEKTGVISQSDAVFSRIVEARADMLIIGRRQLVNYPPYQEFMETIANDMLSTIYGKKFDHYMGSLVLSRKGIEVFLAYGNIARTEDEYVDLWDSYFVPAAAARLQQLKVVEYEIDFSYPDNQRNSEDDNPEMIAKRKNQLLVSLRAVTKYLLDNGFLTQQRRQKILSEAQQRCDCFDATVAASERAA